MNAGSGKDDDFLGQRREKQADDHDENDQSLDRVPPIERIDLVCQFVWNGQGGLQCFVREHPDDSVSGGHCENDRDTTPKQITAKIQMSDLSDHHVLWIADECHRPADVA